MIKVDVFVVVAGAAIAEAEAKRAKARMAADNFFIKKSFNDRFNFKLRNLV
jgi:hypothetical protein